MEKRKVRFGIIGYGFMGHNHGRTIGQLEDAELVAVCDNNEKQLYGIPEGVTVYHDMDLLLEDQEVDAVIVSVPNNIHLETVKKAARAGKDILCEKPAAMSPQEFDEMMKVVHECGVKFSVHQQRRWDKDYRTAKKVYDDKSLGDVYTVQTKLYGFNGNMHDWHIYPELLPSGRKNRSYHKASDQCARRDYHDRRRSHPFLWPAGARRDCYGGVAEGGCGKHHVF